MNVNNAPLISIIIPFLNVEAFLDETIGSVLHQEYTNWEIILIDDGSIDGSADIAKKYAAERNNIRYVAHEGGRNRGAAASRNLGVANAKGEWLAFLDADDFWTPQKLKEQVVILKANPEATVLCEATTYWYSWYNSASKDLFFPVGAPAERLYYPPDLAHILYPLGKGHSFCTCGLIMKTDAFKEMGGFDETFVGKDQLYEDQVLFIKICLHQTVYISSKCNNFYRQRPDSLMHGLLSEGYYMQGRYYFLQWLIKYLDEQKIHDARIQKLIYKALWPYRHPKLFYIKKLPLKIGRKIKSLVNAN